MKGSRITAFGLVVGAGLWIASGHFLPHESAESRAAVRTNESDVKKLEKDKQISKYSGTSLIGKLGIEASFEETLHGVDGSRQILVNAAGRSVQRNSANLTPEQQEEEKRKAGLTTIDPVPGRDLITGIDLPTQLVAEQGLIGRRA